MTFQVILDSRFRGNDNCSVPSTRGRMSVCMLLLLTAIVIASWTTALADSTDQSSAPSGEAVQQSESTPVLTSDSEKVNVYKTLLEDKRNITDKILANQQSNFQIALWTIGLIIAILLATVGFFGYKQIKVLIDQKTSQFDQKLQMVIGDTDRFVSAMSSTAQGEFLSSQFFLLPHEVSKKHEDYMRVVWAFERHVNAVDSLVQIVGNTPSLKDLYLRNLSNIENCLKVVPRGDMYQRAVDALKRDMDALKQIPLWKLDHEIHKAIDRVEKALDDVDRPSPFDDPNKESDSESK